MNENFYNFNNFEELYKEYLGQCDEDWTKGAVYIRVSTKLQLEYSPTAQLKKLLDYALKNKIFIDISNIFHDDGVSGKSSEKRTSFMKMIEKARAKIKPFDIILVYDFSRFARNKEESVMYKHLLRKDLDIDIISITQPIANGLERVFTEGMYEIIDEYNVLKFAFDSRRGKHEKASRGEHNGNAPYGYKYDKNLKLLIIDEEKANVIRLIFNDYVNNVSIRSIVMKLNNMGIKPARKDLWCDRSIKLILHNPAYIGKVRYTQGGMERDYFREDTEIFEGKHEAIIDMDIWERAQQLNLKRREVYSNYIKPAPKHEHWLRGIIKCGDCGHSMVKFGAKSRKNPHFQCAWYVKGKCKRSHHIKCHLVEEAILEELKNACSGKIEINISSNNVTYDTEIEIILSSIQKQNNKLTRAKNAYLNEIDTLEEYKRNKDTITNEINNLEEQLNKLKFQSERENRKKQVLNKCDEAYKILLDEDVSEQVKFDISHELFEKIVYDKDNEKLIITYK